MSLATQLQSLATRIATETKSIRTLVNGNQASLSSLSTSAKSNLVAAINEVVTSVAAAQSTANSKAAIDDAATGSTTTTRSGSKIDQLIATAVSNLVAASPAVLDTLKELADAIGDDPNYAATTATALGNRLRFDAAQTLTTGQQTQGQSNLAVYSKTEVGDPATDFVATFVSGLA